MKAPSSPNQQDPTQIAQTLPSSSLPCQLSLGWLQTGRDALPGLQFMQHSHIGVYIGRQGNVFPSVFAETTREDGMLPINNLAAELLPGSQSYLEVRSLTCLLSLLQSHPNS